MIDKEKKCKILKMSNLRYIVKRSDINKVVPNNPEFVELLLII